jgi:uncharacterized protein YjbI with pentapeptide repeats
MYSILQEYKEVLKQIGKILKGVDLPDADLSGANLTNSIT